MNRLLRVLLLLWLCLSVFRPAICQVQRWQDTIQQRFPYSTMALFPLPSLGVLEGEWQDEAGTAYRIPFSFPGRASHTLKYKFQLECDPGEDLFLHFEGIAWQAEVIFNEKYLGLHEDPFAAWTIPIRAAWLADSGSVNRIEVQLSGGRWHRDYPEAFTGIFRPAYVLTADQLPFHTDPAPAPDSLHKRIAVVAPWYGESGVIFEESAAIRLLIPLLREGIGQIYFPFPADSRMKNLLIQSGMRLVTSIPDTAEVCFLNEYPAERGSLSGDRYFWLDPSGRRTYDYQSYFPLRPKPRLPVAAPRFLLVLLMLFPLLGLFAIKGISPHFFHSMDAVLFSPKLYLDTFSESTYANLGLVFLLISVKTVVMAAVLSLCVHYIQLEHQWNALNLIKDWSMISTVFYGAHTLPGIFLRSLLLMLAWMGFKYLFISFFGKIYGFRGMLIGMLNLDIVSAYPLVLLLSVPVSFMYFVPQVWGGIFGIFTLIVWMAYILRRLYVYFIGLDRLFMLSFGVKILYICAFNILPYMILF